MAKEKNGGPLLFISQPNMKKSPIKEQSSFVIKKEDIRKENEGAVRIQEVEAKKEVDEESGEGEIEDYVIQVVEEIQHFEEVREEAQNKVEEDEQEQEEANPVNHGATEQINTGEIQKPFREMTNSEKVYFILQRPKYIPQVKCRIKTKNGDYMGYIIEYVDDTVHFKVATRLEPVYIKTDNIIKFEIMW